jgi:hypothetical protein
VQRLKKRQDCKEAALNSENGSIQTIKKNKSLAGQKFGE